MSMALFQLVQTRDLAASAVTNAKILAGTIQNSRLRGFKGNGVATLVAGTVTVTPGTWATAADDVWRLYESTVGGGADGELRISAIVPGAAGVGNFDITSRVNTDVGVAGYVQLDNTHLT